MRPLASPPYDSKLSLKLERGGQDAFTAGEMQMPIQNQVLVALQAAGAAVHAADIELKSAIRARANGLKRRLSTDPYSVVGVELYEDWKSLATLSAAVSEVESQMLKIYDAASQGLVLHDESAGATRVTHKARKSALASPDLTESPQGSTTVLTPRPIRGNAAKVYALLKDRLNGESFSTLNQAGFAKEHGISIGSIGAAIDILIKKGYLEKGGRRQLKLKSGL